MANMKIILELTIEEVGFLRKVLGNFPTRPVNLQRPRAEDLLEVISRMDATDFKVLDDIYSELHPLGNI